MSEALVKRWITKKKELQKEWEMSGKSWEMQQQLLTNAWCSRNKTRVTRSAGGDHEEAEAKSENVDDCHPIISATTSIPLLVELSDLSALPLFSSWLALNL